MTAAITAVVSALVATIVAFAKAKSSNAMDETKAMHDGMRALLWRELKNLYSEAISNDGMTTEERNHLESVYQAYHGIGGNGTGTRLYEDAMATRVKE